MTIGRTNIVMMPADWCRALPKMRLVSPLPIFPHRSRPLSSVLPAQLSLTDIGKLFPKGSLRRESPRAQSLVFTSATPYNYGPVSFLFPLPLCYLFSLTSPSSVSVSFISLVVASRYGCLASSPKAIFTLAFSNRFVVCRPCVIN
jgi:hypothetical protein